ncbi:MAG: helix-turn-helix domain-containing protein [Methanobrevibacter sp.]|nr:helix-turn-helix domain-containing protein [Candidatus Methanovirga procula]
MQKWLRSQKNINRAKIQKNINRAKILLLLDKDKKIQERVDISNISESTVDKIKKRYI